MIATTFLFMFTLGVVAIANALDSIPDVNLAKFFNHLKQFRVDINDGIEFLKRFKIFLNNIQLIDAHNLENGTSVWGLNQFSHLSDDEFKDYVKSGGFLQRTTTNAVKHDTG